MALREVLHEMRTHAANHGFGARIYHRSEVLEKVRALPDGLPIYSNGADAVYIWTGRRARYLPRLRDPGTRVRNEDFDLMLGILENDLRQREGLIVWLDAITWRAYMPSEEDLERRLDLRVVYRGFDGSIYGAVPSRP